MNDPLMQAYLEVERSMQRYNEVLDHYLISLQSAEGGGCHKTRTHDGRNKGHERQ